MQNWIGHSIREYIEEKSVSPTDAFNNPDGTRTYIFRVENMYGSCGSTFKTTPSNHEFIITSINSTCGFPQF
jgi:hypothetical protein